jgi:hypothetical protein
MTVRVETWLVVAALVMLVPAAGVAQDARRDGPVDGRAADGGRDAAAADARDGNRVEAAGEEDAAEDGGSDEAGAAVDASVADAGRPDTRATGGAGGGGGSSAPATGGASPPAPQEPSGRFAGATHAPPPRRHATGSCRLGGGDPGGPGLVVTGLALLLAWRLAGRRAQAGTDPRDPASR